MKNILFSIALVASLVFGSTVAFANTTANQSGVSHMETTAKKLKKGLDEALVIDSGKDSWVLHQPKENPLRYFLLTSGGQMAGGHNGEGQAKHQES